MKEHYIKQDPSLIALQAQWPESISDIQPLQGGLTNQCWKITTSCGRHYVWRPHSISTQSFSINRSNEFEVLNVLEGFALSPNVQALLPQGLLVEWVDGVTLMGQHNETLSLLVVKCLVYLHQYPLPQNHSLPIFDYQSCIENYWQALPSQQQTQRYQQWFERFYQQYDELKNRTESILPPCLCHFDLGSYNIIQKPDLELVVIDWEYAAMASPVVDLATTILAEQLSVEESVECYRELSRLDIDKSQFIAIVEEWLPYLRFMALLWHQVNFSLHQRASDKQAIEVLTQQLELSES
ncbi:phosphotransferase [Vibrio sp. CK2-1]|uniref:phosphotransferase n=1 Tax=Vibrio sp. CK2-1 TaxID=2912249 RepID=UPI001F37F190|nr:phosphotransferase [Vibrio sp. CK2-1]MCF7354791.1 phosphotransferase [Vibrio sp. CK2-1]